MNGNLTPDIAYGVAGRIEYRDMHFEYGERLGMVLSWRVVTKTRMKGEVSYYSWNGTKKDLDGYNEIPHTEDREKWFENFETSFLGMLLKVHEFMQIKPEELIKSIDSGKRINLLGGRSS